MRGYDRWRLGLDDHRKRPVKAKCVNEHYWGTVECVERGRPELQEPDCPTCGEEALLWRPDEESE